MENKRWGNIVGNDEIDREETKRRGKRVRVGIADSPCPVRDKPLIED